MRTETSIETTTNNDAELTRAHKLAKTLVNTLGKVLIGKEGAVEKAVVALLSKGHLLIEDVPGVGKTTLALGMAKALDLSFQRIQFTSDLLPSDVTGTTVFDQKEGEFKFRPGPIFANIVLADEINRSTPKTQSALLEAMQDRKITVDGTPHILPDPFLVIATQNPVEHYGTYPLPESQMDRFLMRLEIGYPDMSHEMEILNTGGNTTNALPQAVISRKDLEFLISAAENIYAEESIKSYILTIAEKTRQSSYLELGVSPRGTLALLSASKSLALIRGRNFCTPDDVKYLAADVLSHRVIPAGKFQIHDTKAIRATALIINEILDSIPVPI